MNTAWQMLFFSKRKSGPERIPRIIHQIWFGDQNQRPVREIESWTRLNPDWEVRLWTEKEVKKEFGRLRNQKQYRRLEDLYKNLHPKVPVLQPRHYLCGRSDLVRYEILYRFGGFFVDADAEALRPLDDFFCDNDSFCVYENESYRPGLLANGYLGATKGNRLMKALIDKIKKIKDITSDEPWKLTGPQLLTDTVRELKYDAIQVYPSYYFIPHHYSGESYEGDDTEHIYATQKWGSTRADFYES